MPPQKGKNVNYKQLYDTLLSTLKSKGDPIKVNFIIKKLLILIKTVANNSLIIR